MNPMISPRYIPRKYGQIIHFFFNQSFVFKMTNLTLIVACKLSNATFTFTFSKVRGSLSNYKFIHDIKRKRCIIPYEIHYKKLFLEAQLLRIFIHHKLFLPTKWKIFLVPLWGVFVFEKIKNKTSQNVFFFLMKVLYIEKVVQLQ